MGRETVAEIAEREAAEAEGVTPDDGDGDNGDEGETDQTGDASWTDDADAQPEGATTADVDKALQKLENEAARHGKRVAEIMGDDFAMLEMCPLDFTPGYVMPAMAAQLPDDVKDRVRALIGDGDAADLEPAEGVEACPRCKRKGRLKYPTDVVHVKTQPCPKCTGQGYVTLPPPAPEAVSTFTPQPWDAGLLTTTNGPGAPDSWQRPPGHPHYGMPPASVGA